MLSFCERHISQFQPISFIINRHIRDWHVDDARHNFPSIFSEQIVSDRTALWCHWFARDIYTASQRSAQSIGERGIYIFSFINTKGGTCGRKREQDDEKDTLTRERKRERESFPVLMVKRGIRLLDFARRKLFNISIFSHVNPTSVFSNAKSNSFPPSHFIYFCWKIFNKTFLNSWVNQVVLLFYCFYYFIHKLWQKDFYMKEVGTACSFYSSYSSAILTRRITAAKRHKFRSYTYIESRIPGESHSSRIYRLFFSFCVQKRCSSTCHATYQQTSKLIPNVSQDILIA